MSSISTAPSSKIIISHECESPEESGWTKYFDDFFLSNNNNDHDQKCSISFSGADHSSSSLVSDAAIKKLTHDSTQAEEYGKELSFKKRKKIKTAFVDDALEDTATSPINGSDEEKGNSSGERDDRKELCFNERDSDLTKLKKKGLCLVPLSMMVNYLG
ncbi:hypothetical protein RJT34_29033 [Clitoria ternatea]|uniref:Uncharacterized protein n=1 Tax=Clitoria ternatea TaxID=43366 RepID=A0AAN9I9F6_CLITE